MTEVFEKVTTDEDGNILKLEHVQKPAICDGRDNWYSTSGRSASAGRTWADLC